MRDAAHDDAPAETSTTPPDATAADADAGAIDADPGGLVTCPILDVPSTCEQLHGCGLVSDGLGGILQCGSCPRGLACALGQCVWPADAGPCVPATCGDYGANCGSVDDGCGATTACGPCSAPQYCGGAGLRRCGGACAAQPVSRNMDCGVAIVCRPDAMDASQE